ncbi:MAG: hypothetical protein D6805_00870 [Planctomycetota bacterium]|nr:MAG: hypothetical protein D6805_00870 [Planctomycetota bacterium]
MSGVRVLHRPFPSTTRPTFILPQPAFPSSLKFPPFLAVRVPHPHSSLLLPSIPICPPLS